VNPEVEHRMIGRTLSHYRIVAELGSGGMGRVFRAEDTLLGRPVALKFPHHHLVHDSPARARFLREARISSVLDHPNIVVLYDVGEVEGEIFLAMQCVEGRSLRERLRDGPVAPDETTSIGRAVADALAHAHARGVVHRDIKPENILVCGDGRVKVADFGLALRSDATVLTETNAILGTVGYLAPEVLAGTVADARSDLFALGAVLYEMCAGFSPFQAESPAAVLYRIAHEEPPPLPSSGPAALAHLVTRLLSKRPADRPASAVEVAGALASITEPRPSTAATPSPARSIAVLYFENMTGDPAEDYFCAGITEDLLTDLLKIPDLNVASRNAVAALRGRPVDMRQAGRDLGVATILEGSVRRAGHQVRVTAQLVRTDTGFHLWGERYDRKLEDIFEVQEDIARNIAGALRVVLTPGDGQGHLGRRTANPRAYDLRLQALALHRRQEEADMRRAIALLEEALRLDPDYALARADLAECYVQLFCKAWDADTSWLDRAEAEVRRAMDLAPSLPEAFRARGHVWMHRRLPRRALRDFQLAVDLDPRFAGAVNNVAVAYVVLKDPGRAEISARRARELDPQLVPAYVNLGVALLLQGRYSECSEALAAGLALETGRNQRLGLLETLLVCHMAQGDRAAVERVAERVRREDPDPLSRSMLALATAFLGDADGARRGLLDPELGISASPRVHINVAGVHALLDDQDAARAALERAFRLDVVHLAEARAHPELAALLEDPRFIDPGVF